MRVTGPNGRNNSCKSCSRVSSDKLDTRIEFSSRRRSIDAPAPVAPARIDGGTYPPGFLGPSPPSSSGGLLPSFAKSLYGHFEVQWSPFFPHVRHTNSDV